MATSGNTAFEMTRDGLINSALRKCGVLEKGEVADATDLTVCGEALNALLQTFVTLGMPLWKRITVQIPLVDNQPSYTINNALKAPQALITTTSSGSTQELQLESLYDFSRLTTASKGSPTSYTVQPTLENLTISVWPRPDATTASTKTLTVIYQKEFDGFINASDTPDFPAYWSESLIYGLAVRISPEYGVPLLKKQELEKDFKMTLAAAQSYGDEDGSIWFTPERY